MKTKLFKPLFALSCAAVLLTTVFVNANANVKSVSATKIEFTSTKALNHALAGNQALSAPGWYVVADSNGWFLVGTTK
jgi:hypothetical protein